MDDSQFDLEEGNSSQKIRPQLAKVNEPLSQDQPSTSTEKSLSRKENLNIESSGEDIR